MFLYNWGSWLGFLQLNTLSSHTRRTKEKKTQAPEKATEECSCCRKLIAQHFQKEPE